MTLNFAYLWRNNGRFGNSPPWFSPRPIVYLYEPYTGKLGNDYRTNKFHDQSLKAVFAVSLRNQK